MFGPSLDFFPYLVALLTLPRSIYSHSLPKRACASPIIKLISPYEVPSDGWLFRGSIAFAVDVQDVNTISEVEFFINGESTFKDTSYPYGLLWNTRDLDLGTYRLKVVATNSCGAYASIYQDVDVASPLVKSEATGSVITDGLLPDIEPAIKGVNLRDTTVALGADNMFYLSGTGSDNNAWHHNEGINLWKSSDLKTWSYVGLVWSFERDGTDDERTWWTYKNMTEFRAVWAPEFQYIDSNYYITYSLQSKGSKLLRSTTGKPEGPYEVAGGPDHYLFNNIDGSLFTSLTDPESGYLCYESGNIFKLDDAWNVTTGDVTRVDQGDEGCFVFHWKNKYYMSVAKFMSNGRYSSYVGIASYPTGPYSDFHEALPCGGHNTYFVDKYGSLWGTFFGNDKQAPWREQPALVKMATRSNGTLYPDTDQSVDTCWWVR